MIKTESLFQSSIYIFCQDHTKENLIYILAEILPEVLFGCRGHGVRGRVVGGGLKFVKKEWSHDFHTNNQYL